MISYSLPELPCCTSSQYFSMASQLLSWMLGICIFWDHSTPLVGDEKELDEELNAHLAQKVDFVAHFGLGLANGVEEAAPPPGS